MRTPIGSCLVALLLSGHVSSAVAQETPAPPVAPDDATRDRARDYFRAGRAHQEASEWDVAISEYEAGYALVPLPEFLFNIGQCYRSKDDKVRAVAYYRRYLAAAPTGRGASEARDHIIKLTEEIERDAAEAERAKAEKKDTVAAAPTPAPAPAPVAIGLEPPRPPPPPPPPVQPGSKLLVYASGGLGIYPFSNYFMPTGNGAIGARYHGSFAILDVRALELLFMLGGHESNGEYYAPLRVSLLWPSSGHRSFWWYGGFSLGAAYLHEDKRQDYFPYGIVDGSRWTYPFGAVGGFEVKLGPVGVFLQTELGVSNVGRVLFGEFALGIGRSYGK